MQTKAVYLKTENGGISNVVNSGSTSYMNASLPLGRITFLLGINISIGSSIPSVG